MHNFSDIVEMLVTWFDSLSPTLKGYWVIACSASFSFLIQTTLIQTSTDLPRDPDPEKRPRSNNVFQFFSLHSCIHFLMGLGWGGVILSSFYFSPLKTGIYALLSGLLCTILFYFMINAICKPRHYRMFRMKDTIGLTAIVTVDIPGQQTERGKIEVEVQGFVYNFDAMTEGDAIPAGQQVNIVEIIDNHTLSVTFYVKNHLIS